jgi:hypothetical protein
LQLGIVQLQLGLILVAIFVHVGLQLGV